MIIYFFIDFNNINNMDYMNTLKMFKNKILKIPDYFTSSDIQEVYHYFDYYISQKSKNVTYYDHVESEYNIEDKQFYGYAIIEIKNIIITI